MHITQSNMRPRLMGALNQDTNQEKLPNPIVPYMVPDTTFGHLLIHITQSNMWPGFMDALNWDQNQEKLPNRNVVHIVEYART